MTAPQRSHNRRNGISITEVLVAVVLLGLLMGMSGMALSRIVVQRRVVARRTLAAEVLANVLERINALDYGSTSEARLQEIRLPASSRAALPGSTLHVVLDELPDDPLHARRVVVRLAWQDRPNRPKSEIQCVVFKYPWNLETS